MSSLRSMQEMLARRLTLQSLPSDADSSLLEGIDVRALEQGSETLFRKRLSQTKTLLPRSSSLLNRQLPILFRKYHTDHHFDGYRAPLLDAISFSDWLGTRSEVPDWIQEFARWESLPKRTLLTRWMFRLDRFYYSKNIDVNRSDKGFEAGPKSKPFGEAPPRRYSLWLTYRVGGRNGISRPLIG